MDDEEMFVFPLPRIMVFTVIVELVFALYGAASAGRDIVALYLRLQ